MPLASSSSSSSSSSSPWLTCVSARPHASYMLINFGWKHNRGGRGSDYSGLSCANVATEFEVFDVVLPGHGSRFSEPPCDDVRLLIRQLGDALKLQLPSDGRPFAFLGYAFGAILAYETALLMQQESTSAGHVATDCVARVHPVDRPVLVCTVSSEGPEWLGRESMRPLHQLPLHALAAELRSRGGMQEVMEEIDAMPELLDIFMPIIAADLRLEETYYHAVVAPAAPEATAAAAAGRVFGPGIRRLSCAVLCVVGGKPGRDLEHSIVDPEAARLWTAASSARASRVIIAEEDDFFLLEDDDGTQRCLEHVREHFRRHIAPIMPWATIACATNPTPEMLLEARRRMPP